MKVFADRSEDELSSDGTELIVDDLEDDRGMEISTVESEAAPEDEFAEDEFESIDFMGKAKVSLFFS